MWNLASVLVAHQWNELEVFIVQEIEVLHAGKRWVAATVGSFHVF